MGNAKGEDSRWRVVNQRERRPRQELARKRHRTIAVTVCVTRSAGFGHASALRCIDQQRPRPAHCNPVANSTPWHVLLTALAPTRATATSVRDFNISTSRGTARSCFGQYAPSSLHMLPSLTFLSFPTPQWPRLAHFGFSVSPGRCSPLGCRSKARTP